MSRTAMFAPAPSAARIRRLPLVELVLVVVSVVAGLVVVGASSAQAEEVTPAPVVVDHQLPTL